MQEIIIKQSPMRLIRLILICIGIIVMFYSVYNISTVETVNFICLAGIIFCSIILLIGLKKLFNPKAALIVNGQGIIDNSSLIGIGAIKWDEVKSLDMTIIQGRELIAIDLIDTDKTLSRVSASKAKIIRLNMSLGFSPVSISIQTSKYPLRKIFETMQEFYKNRA